MAAGGLIDRLLDLAAPKVPVETPITPRQAQKVMATFIPTPVTPTIKELPPEPEEIKRPITEEPPTDAKQSLDTLSPQITERIVEKVIEVPIAKPEVIRENYNYDSHGNLESIEEEYSDGTTRIAKGFNTGSVTYVYH